MAIRIRGARTHNLKNLHVDIPRDQLTVITGISGSGKSTLAFDTLFAEGQRRYVESLSAYARQFLSLMEKPDVDTIEGLSPAIAIEQKTVSHNPRSTVGTVTEIYDYLRLLFARAGTPYCPDHHLPLAAMSMQDMVERILTLPEGKKIMLLAPVIRGRKGEHAGVLEQLSAQGLVRARIDGTLHDLDTPPTLDPQQTHHIDAVVDRLRLHPDARPRLLESLETACTLSGGLVTLAWLDEDDQNPEWLLSAQQSCPKCGTSIAELEPKLFSFNSPMGACPDCDGLGTRRFIDIKRVVIDPSLSIDQGVIRGLDQRHQYFYETMQALAKHYDFSLETPFQDLCESIQNMILHGSGREKITFQYGTSRFGRRQSKRPFEGIIPQMERRLAETESEAVREELQRYISYQACSSCQGSRLNRMARAVRVGPYDLPTLTQMPIDELHHALSNLTLEGHRGDIASRILKEITTRLHFLISVGLNYLNLGRTAETLSGGESQRIRLASQIGSGLMGVLYVLDEPSIGLHQRDNQRLLDTLTHLRDLGNTVVVVEHDEDAIRQADHVIDIGPGAGVHGGELVAQGRADELSAVPKSLTGAYLSLRLRIEVPSQRHAPNPKRMLRIVGATANNLQSLDADIPLGLMTCVTGVSGSGKSTLINDTLLPAALKQLNRSLHAQPAAHERIEGLEQLDKVVAIDQSPIGRTPRSNPATYTGVFTPIRELFAQTEEARARGYKPGRFSFNVKGGRCETCQGDGMIKVEMHFLADMYVTCERCQGQRYHEETQQILYKGKHIADVLNMTCEEALTFFAAIPTIANKLQTLVDVGLSYMKLGQSATTLSGGEAQRIKLAKELAKRASGNTLYILDEPTTGLHFHDVQQLLNVLHRLRDQGNTVVIIEHHMDVIKTADWIVDLGPEGGNQGGQRVAQGTPETVVECEASHTGRWLKTYLPGNGSPCSGS